MSFKKSRSYSSFCSVITNTLRSSVNVFASEAHGELLKRMHILIVRY